ncbi:MAG TPA: aminomethyl-transferring glycine dehydrogenase subunit GcvPA, partial [Ktedonobacterales bacterium]
MSYVPSTSAEQQAMLKAIGVESLEELLTAIPDEVRFHGALDLPPALREADVRRAVSALAAKNASAAQAASFLGAGTYEHVIPSVVPHLMKRSEFYTSYTPYQPEVSQGMLQAIYEFQTMVCEISGMDVANASLYDGSTAVVEGALLAVGPEGTGEVLVSRAVDPQYRATLRTYAWARGFTVREIELDGGVTALAKLEAAITPETKAVIIQHPNFFGCLEDVYGVEKLVRASKALFIVAISEPASLGILTPPGEYGADIVAAEGGTLGMPPSFGGPALGLFATKGEHVRRMPGRLAGRTVDNRGQTG